MPPEAPPQAPGRYCPLAYHYPTAVFRRAPDIEAQTLYVIGGLYGNALALDVIEQRAQREAGPVALIFNGDFNWFNVDAEGFASVNARVLRHHALRGNVETELANDDEGAGCGCAYPESVSDAEVARSNLIQSTLRATAGGVPELRARLGTLPMHLVAKVGGVRVGIVHGDAQALAGWKFGCDALDDPENAGWLAQCFAEAGVQIFASSHTCLPVCRAFPTPGGTGIVVNNGAAGMPNFAGTHYGIITRISLTPAPEALYGAHVDGVHVDALPVRYDQAAWLAAFLRNWPRDSPAHQSYWNRLVNGPAGRIEQTAPSRVGRVSRLVRARA